MASSFTLLTFTNFVGGSLLTEHFEQLGTPNSVISRVFSTSSVDDLDDSSDVSRLSRSTSISARFLSKSQMRANRLASTFSLFAGFLPV